MRTIMITAFTRVWAETLEELCRTGGGPVTMLAGIPLGDHGMYRRYQAGAMLMAAVEDEGAFILEDDVDPAWHWQDRFVKEFWPEDHRNVAVAMFVGDFCRTRCTKIPGSPLEHYDHRGFVGNQALWWGARLADKVSRWLHEYEAQGGELPVDDAMRLCPHLEGRLLATPIDLFQHKPGPSHFASSRVPFSAGRFTKGNE